MELTGSHWIAGIEMPNASETFRVTCPLNQSKLSPAFAEGNQSVVDTAFALANKTFLSRPAREQLAVAFETAVRLLSESQDDLLKRAYRETGIDRRLMKGDWAQCRAQLIYWSTLLRNPAWFSETGVGKPGGAAAKIPFRAEFQPLGIVVCFPSSNVPFSFGPLGVDVVSALAAGCPVVVKGHPLNAGTTEWQIRIMQAALKEAEISQGYLSLVQGATPETSSLLVQHSAAAAVGFIGSHQVAQVLRKLISERQRWIPLYGEDGGGANPTFVLPGALDQYERISVELANAITYGVGQFCTQTGLVVVPRGDAGDKLVHSLCAEIRKVDPGTMLSNGTRGRYLSAVRDLDAIDGISTVASSTAVANDSKTQVGAVLLETDIGTVSRNPQCLDECFGPSAVVLRCDDNELEKAARLIPAHLVSNIYGIEADQSRCLKLRSTLAKVAGRICWNEPFPNIVYLNDAQQHGGGKETSVGHEAARRFAKRVALQGNWPTVSS